MPQGLRRTLARADPIVFTIVAEAAGFCAYVSMYAFRKPFTAAAFEHVSGWSFALDFKIALVIAQAIGYTLSKLIGVKIISEIDPTRRRLAILALIATSWVALTASALIPAPWNVTTLFLNGLRIKIGSGRSEPEPRRRSSRALLCVEAVG